MKTSTKAALFSAIIVPGAGQWYLQRHVLAIFFSLTSLSFLVIVLLFITQKFDIVTEQVLRGELTPTLPVLFKKFFGYLSQPPLHVRIALTSMPLLWLVSIVDACFIGHIKDKQNSKKTN